MSAFPSALMSREGSDLMPMRPSLHSFQEYETMCYQLLFILPSSFIPYCHSLGVSCCSPVDCYDTDGDGGPLTSPLRQLSLPPTCCILPTWHSCYPTSSNTHTFFFFILGIKRKIPIFTYLYSLSSVSIYITLFNFSLSYQMMLLSTFSDERE